MDMGLIGSNVYFMDKIAGNRRLIFAFEAVPPPLKGDLASVAGQRAEDIAKRINPNADCVDAFFIPELVNGRGYMPPVSYADALKYKINSEFVLYRVTVHEKKQAQISWLENAVQNGYSNIIPVGGDSGSEKYPGISPLEFAPIASRMGFFQGGVCIPSRGKLPRGKNPLDFELESRKMVEKENAGISYHVTQILYETEGLKTTLQHYKNLSQENQSVPKRVII